MSEQENTMYRDDDLAAALEDRIERDSDYYYDTPMWKCPSCRDMQDTPMWGPDGLCRDCYEEQMVSPYCQHGTYIGYPGGPDYLCGYCEMGE